MSTVQYLTISRDDLVLQTQLMVLPVALLGEVRGEGGRRPPSLSEAIGLMMNNNVSRALHSVRTSPAIISKYRSS